MRAHQEVDRAADSHSQYVPTRAGDTTVESLTISHSLNMLPKFYSAKLFVLVDKMCNMVTGLSSGMILGMEHVLSRFPNSELDINLKGSKAFKNWHRGMEDLIDETAEQCRNKLQQLSQIFYEVTQNDKAVKDYMHKYVLDSFMENSGRSPKKISDTLIELSKIIEQPSPLEISDYDPSRIIKSSRNYGNPQALNSSDEKQKVDLN